MSSPPSSSTASLAGDGPRRSGGTPTSCCCEGQAVRGLPHATTPRARPMIRSRLFGLAIRAAEIDKRAARNADAVAFRDRCPARIFASGLKTSVLYLPGRCRKVASSDDHARPSGGRRCTLVDETVRREKFRRRTSCSAAASRPTRAYGPDDRAGPSLASYICPRACCAPFNAAMIAHAAWRRLSTRLSLVGPASGPAAQLGMSALVFPRRLLPHRRLAFGRPRDCADGGRGLYAESRIRRAIPTRAGPSG